MKAGVPRRHDSSVGREEFCAGEMNGICTTERVLLAEVSSSLRHPLRQFDQTQGPPEVLPCASCLLDLVIGEATGAVRRCKRGAHLWVAHPAAEDDICPVPQCSSFVAPVLLDEQLHESTGIEVADQRRRVSRSRITSEDTGPRARTR